ncbi:MAG: type III-B CRISPR module RAMP protein Cmr1 [Candidatus Competibacteraceae bacterium]|nr:type III-B CRISPR module RAMP protein Cmr1 [Candidatus Competibacteraceae bacterium]MCB1820681.1 type III-B CRISPR module RAMP protein Cmr1 [Candidatus Competibacteraceae bacterium]
MSVLTATYRIVTPMFIGNAEQKADSVRPPSIKGALRFWWRALNWGRFLREDGTVTVALKHLHQKEAYLFGSAADEPGSGQGRFLLRVSHQPRIALETVWPQNNTGSGYLGYGLMATNDKPHREGLKEGTDFCLELRFKPGTPPADIDALTATLRTWSLFGGLGSRARRGFGSVTLLKLNDQDERLDQSAYEAAARRILTTAAEVEAFPPYTAFNRHAQFGILANGREARETHNQAGLQYKNHRGQPSALRGAAKIPFGLPLPLQGIDLESRRASPLFFHIHALPDGGFTAAVLYLPAEFHCEPRHQPADLAGFYREVARFVPAEAQP